MNKKLFAYLSIACGWTWLLWLGSYWLGQSSQLPLNLNLNIFEVIGLIGQPNFLIQALFALAVYGPLCAYLLVKPTINWLGQPTKKMLITVILLPVLMMLPSLLLGLSFGYLQPFPTVSQPIIMIGTYFLANLITSGTEEFGWRGWLYPYLQTRTKTFWDNALKGGLLWALWHYPLMVMLYAPAGLAVLLPSLVGFTISIIGMNYLTNVIFERTKSIALAMLLHALNNTTNFLLILLFPRSPFAIVANVMVWVAVAYFERQYQIDQPQINS
jgi:membrane protease YdiL (CAAX protease family)